jgi:simple sugar transport system ATP-binding protein
MELAELMVGRHVLMRVEKGPSTPGETVLEVKNLTWKDRKGIARVDNVSFSVRKGEIVGIAGVSGNGQSELLDVIAGIARPTSGQVIFEGKDIGILGDPRDANAQKGFDYLNQLHQSLSEFVLEHCLIAVNP